MVYVCGTVDALALRQRLLYIAPAGTVVLVVVGTVRFVVEGLRVAGKVLVVGLHIGCLRRFFRLGAFHLAAT